MNKAQRLIAKKVRASLPLDAFRDQHAVALAEDLVEELVGEADAIILKRDGTIHVVQGGPFRESVGFHHDDVLRETQKWLTYRNIPLEPGLQEAKDLAAAPLFEGDA